MSQRLKDDTLTQTNMEPKQLLQKRSVVLPFYQIWIHWRGGGGGGGGGRHRAASKFGAGDR